MWQPEEEEDRTWRARGEAVCAVVARLSLRGVTMRLFLVLSPWAYFLAIFRSCWQCYDFEGATAHHIGHLLGLGNPNEVSEQVNSYHAGFASGSAPSVNASTCQGDLWADVRPGVPPGAAVDPMIVPLFAIAMYMDGGMDRDVNMYQCD